MPASVEERLAVPELLVGLSQQVEPHVLAAPGVALGPGEPLDGALDRSEAQILRRNVVGLHRIGVRRADPYRALVERGIAERAGDLTHRDGRGVSPIAVLRARRRPRLLLVEARQPAKLELGESDRRLVEERVARPVAVSGMQLVNALHPGGIRRQRRGGLMPQATRAAKAVADRAVRVVGSAEDACIRADETVDELPGRVRIGGEQPRLHVVEPGVELAREAAALAVRDEGSAVPEPLQPALERSGVLAGVRAQRERLDALAQRIVPLGQPRDERRELVGRDLGQPCAKLVRRHERKPSATGASIEVAPALRSVRSRHPL